MCLTLGKIDYGSNPNRKSGKMEFVSKENAGEQSEHHSVISVRRGDHERKTRFQQVTGDPLAILPTLLKKDLKTRNLRNVYYGKIELLINTCCRGSRDLKMGGGVPPLRLVFKGGGSTIIFGFQRGFPSHNSLFLPCILTNFLTKREGRIRPTEPPLDPPMPRDPKNTKS
jgi:hypothetical protein